jgi:predicted transcriptional regulator
MATQIPLTGGKETPTELDNYEQWKAEEIRAGFAEVDTGERVPNEKVIEWLQSWGTNHELPPPQG